MSKEKIISSNWGDELSDSALRLWGAFFPNPSSTLRFGGKGSDMEITKGAREDLNQLLAFGAIEPTEPDCSIPDREHYKSGGTVLQLLVGRRAKASGDSVFEWMLKDPKDVFRHVLTAEQTFCLAGKGTVEQWCSNGQELFKAGIVGMDPLKADDDPAK